jgi:hypothetical protein
MSGNHPDRNYHHHHRQQQSLVAAAEKANTPPPSPTRAGRIAAIPSPPTIVHIKGHTLIPPTSLFARAVVMGNEATTGRASYDRQQPPPQQPPQVTRSGHLHRHAPPSPRNKGGGQQGPASNLTVLLHQQNMQQQIETSFSQEHVDEADSASGPPTASLGRSAPAVVITQYQTSVAPPRALRHNYTGHGTNLGAALQGMTLVDPNNDKVRR